MATLNGKIQIKSLAKTQSIMKFSMVLKNVSKLQEFGNKEHYSPQPINKDSELLVALYQMRFQKKTSHA